MLESKGVFTLSSKTEFENNLKKMKERIEEKKTEEWYDYLIDKYANKYNINKSNANKEKEQAKIDLQRKLLVGLHDKGIEKTLASEYLSYMMNELDHQYSRKSDIENKTGFVLTFITVLVGVVIGKDNLLKCLYDNINSTDLNADVILYSKIFFYGIISSLSIAIFCAIIALLVNCYRRYYYTRKEFNFNMILDDRAMTYVKLIDTATNLIGRNEWANKCKDRHLKASVVFMIISMALIVWAYIVIPLPIPIN